MTSTDEPDDAGDSHPRTDSDGDDVRGTKVLDVPDDVARPLRELVEKRGTRVLDASVVERIDELSQDFARAENRARQIVEEARREADELRESAREEGRRQGYEELVETIAEVRARYREIQDEAEEDTLELAFRIARRLIGRELERDPSVVRDIVDRALERVHGKRHVVVRVHPDDVEQLEDHADAYSERLDGTSVQIQGDPEIDRGGCILETDANRIDARLDVQLERIREVLEAGDSEAR